MAGVGPGTWVSSLYWERILFPLQGLQVPDSLPCGQEGLCTYSSGKGFALGGGNVWGHIEPNKDSLIKGCTTLGPTLGLHWVERGLRRAGRLPLGHQEGA